MKRCVVMVAATLAAGVAMAQARDNFMQQQAYAEMQRVSGQIDVLQSNFNELSRRVSGLENRGDSESLKAEIAALKNAVAELRRELQQQRGEIVKDLSGRISKIQQQSVPPPQPRVERKVFTGPHVEYTVQSGDSLFLIAKAFNVSVSEIREMNNLKGNNLKVGQKLNIPKK